MQEDGFVAKLFFEAGAKDVLLGSPMAVIVERIEDIAAFANYTGPSSAASAAPAQAAPAQAAPA